jgi:hypothetical protein
VLFTVPGDGVQKRRSAQCFTMRSDINDVIYVMKRKILLLFAFWWLLISKGEKRKRLCGYQLVQGGWRTVFKCGIRRKKNEIAFITYFAVDLLPMKIWIREN